MLDINLNIDHTLYDKLPALKAFHKRVAERPNIAAYFQSGRRPARVNESENGN